MIQRVTSYGGPRVLLPRNLVDKWISELDEIPEPDSGLYGLACSVPGYCGVMQYWGTHLLIFGEDPSDIYFLPDKYDGLFFRWVGADSIEQLTEFAIAQADCDKWDDSTQIRISDPKLTVMDTCTFEGDASPRIEFSLKCGEYRIHSRYVESTDVITILHRLEFVG